MIINGKSYEFNALFEHNSDIFFVGIAPKFLPLLLYSEVFPFCLVMYSLFFSVEEQGFLLSKRLVLVGIWSL